MKLPKRNVGRPANDKLYKQVQELHIKGLKDEEIAKIVGKTRTRVWQIIKKYRDIIELSTPQ